MSSSSRRLLGWTLAWVALLGAAVAVLQIPRPLLINLGAGDEPFARGFRGEWERDGLRQSGETMFRWTEDGARLEFPVDVRGGRLTARLRLARFADTPVEITLLLGDQVLERWSQPPLGWRVRSVDLGEARGVLSLRFRSTGTAAEGLGVALDWVEVRGVSRLLPAKQILPGLAVLLLGVPLVVGLAGRGVLPGLVAATGLLAGAAVAVALDRLGGLLALAFCGSRALALAAALVLVFAGLKRAWPQQLSEPVALWIALSASLLALIALSHPFYYYPDVDTHAHYLSAIRGDPYQAWDAHEFQERTGAWTREVGGRRVSFPYSPMFHLLSWPLALVLGEAGAIKTVAVLALGSSLILVHALARALGLGVEGGLLAQCVLPFLPVIASRLVLALYPTLLGQAFELLLIVHLLRRFPHLEGALDAAAAAFFLLLAQSAYTGSVLNVGALVLTFSAWEAAGGERRRALRLLGAYAVAAAVVVGLHYGRFLPVLWREVLPHVGEAPPAAPRAAGGADLLGLALTRLSVFYDLVYPLLLAPGLVRLRTAPAHGRRLLVSALLAGTLLLLLRFAAPTLFRDAKEIELLAAPVAVVSSAGMAWLWGKGGWRKGTVIAAGLLAGGWGAIRAAELYGGRFLAVGR